MFKEGREMGEGGGRGLWVEEREKEREKTFGHQMDQEI